MSSRPLVQANFYVTETEHENQDLYYYRKSVWEKLINNAVTCLKDQGYRDLDDVNLINMRAVYATKHTKFLTNISSQF